MYVFSYSILSTCLNKAGEAITDLYAVGEEKEGTGWKLVHGDEFSTLLSVSVGTGLQILGMSVVTLLFALLGLLSHVEACCNR